MTSRLIWRMRLSTGEPFKGEITLTPSVVLTHLADNRKVLPRPMKHNLVSQVVVEDGVELHEIFVDLNVLATNDPDFDPTDWTYKVQASFGGSKMPDMNIYAPEDETVDIASLLPIQGTGTPVSHLPVTSVTSADLEKKADIGHRHEDLENRLNGLEQRVLSLEEDPSNGNLGLVENPEGSNLYEIKGA